MTSLRRGRARSVAAGLLDSGMASMATFGVSLYAVRFLEPAVLGAYGVFFTAFVFGVFVPATLYFLPARVAALEAEHRSRVAILPRTLRAGGLVAAVAAALVPLAAVVALGQLSAREIAPLALTASALVLASSMQDHLRATFHLAGLSGHSAAVSGVHLATAALALVFLHSALHSPVWVPFGSLFIANCASMLFGLWLVRADLLTRRAELPRAGVLIRSGRSLFVISALPYAARLLALGMVGSFRSLELVGYAEAARVVASPINVMTAGIGQALSPALMDAGRTGSRPLSRRTRLSFMLALLPLSVAYLLLVGWDVSLNPMTHLVPTAYDLEGLVMLSVVTVLIGDVGSAFRSEVVGAGKGSRLVRWVIFATLAHLCFVAMAMWSLGAYVVFLGLGLAGLIATASAWREARALYVGPDEVRDSGES